MLQVPILRYYFLKNIMPMYLGMMFLFCNCSESIPVENQANILTLPQGEGTDITLKLTKHGTLEALLKAPIFKDFSHLEFPFYEFPKGIELTIYDKKGTSKIYADYAIQYTETKLVVLKNNVRVLTAEGTQLKTDELFWNQELQWIYCDTTFNIGFKTGNSNKGQGFDAKDNFDYFRSHNNRITQEFKH